MTQPITGKRSSTSKLVDVKADDGRKVIFRSSGNNHIYPFVWCETVTMSGTSSVVLASGVKFHGYDLATYGSFIATPNGDPNGYIYVDRNTTTNVVTVKSTGTPASPITVDVLVMLGDAANVLSTYCRDSKDGIMPSLP